ncbi:MAG: hypothetical protein V4717_22295 [Bacteroidota bacterium]
MKKICLLTCCCFLIIADITSQNVGIGTLVPIEKLHISNGNIRLSRTADFNNNIIFNMPPSQLSGEHEGLKFLLFGDEKAFIGYTSTSTSGNFLRLSGAGINANDLTIDVNGNVGIGTNQPSQKLHVAGSALMNATNPTLQLQNAGVDKGFLQLSGDNIRIGTNSGNTAGQFIIRNNGGDRIYVDPDGSTGIGVAAPAAKLHINSGSSVEALRITATGASIIRMMTGGTDKANIFATGNDLSISTVQNDGLVRLNGQVYINNTSNRTGIGTTIPDEKLHVVGNIKVSTGKVLNNDNINMVPVAMGYFNSLGTKIRGTSNISVTRETANSVFHYFVITVAGADLTNAIINVSGIGPQTWASVGTVSGSTAQVLVYENNISEETKWSSFYIVIYN